MGFQLGKKGGLHTKASVENPLYNKGHFRENSGSKQIPIHDVKGLFFCQVSAFFLILPTILYMYLQYEFVYKRYIWIEVIITALSWSIFFIGSLFSIYYTYIIKSALCYYENERGVWMPFSYIDTYFFEGDKYKNFECKYFIEFDEIFTGLNENVIQKGYVLSEIKKIGENDTIFFYTRYKNNILQIFQIIKIQNYRENSIEIFNNAFEEFWTKHVSKEQSDGKVNFMFLLCVKEYSIKLKKAFRGRIVQKDGRKRLGAVIEFGDINELRIMDSYKKERHNFQYKEMYQELMVLLGLKESDCGKRVFKGYVEEYSRFYENM